MSLLDDVDDEAFLLAAEAAEAAANTYSKRPRLSTSPSPTPAASEGSYLSALKGSHSAAWKQQQETLTLAHKRPGGSKVPGVSPGGGVQITKGACFKCGDTSHWARECPQSLQRGRNRRRWRRLCGCGRGGGGEGVPLRRWDLPCAHLQHAQKPRPQVLQVSHAGQWRLQLL
uniref:CCHC-type domain-containing protein n=1 Tax=Aegilops tauschii subsp. strangulata TaxID=200361 RepID=A0A453M027_AEGTS